MRLLPFLLAGFSAAEPTPTREPEISAFQIHFRDDLFEGIQEEEDEFIDNIFFDLTFEHENELVNYLSSDQSLKTSVYKDRGEYGCDVRPGEISAQTSQIYEGPWSDQAYDLENHQLYTVRVTLPLSEWSTLPQLCIRLGLWDSYYTEWVTHMDVVMYIESVDNGVYVGTFSTDLISLDPSSSYKEQTGQLTEKVPVEPFLCGIPGEEGATGLGTPSVPDYHGYKIGQKFRICVQPSAEKAMEFEVFHFKNVFCQIGTPGMGNYKRTIINEYGSPMDIVTSEVWNAAGSASSERTKVLGVRGLSFETVVASAYLDSEAVLTNGNTEIECAGKVVLTKNPFQYQAEFSHNQGTSSEVFEINFFDNDNDWIGNCKEICQQNSYTHFGFECVQKDKDKINCICEVQIVDEASPLDGTYDLQKIGTPAGHYHPSICSDTQYIDGFFLGGVGYYAYMYPIDPEYETSPASQSSGDGLRVLQESETELEEFGFSTSIRIQNEVDNLGRLQDLAAPGADPKVWTIADLVAGFATAAAMAMAAI